MAKIGRKQKHYQASDGSTITGLCRQPDGRWRIISGPQAGYRFSEADESRAIDKYRQLTGGQTPMVWIGDETTLPASQVTDADLQAARAINKDLIQTTGTGEYIARAGLPEDFIYPIMRQLLLADPAKCARLCAIPALTNLLHMDLPKDAITLGSLTAAYEAYSPSKSKKRTLDIFKQMARFTHARTLADLTIEKLGMYRKHVEAASSNGGAKAWKYGQIKAVLSFGLKAGLDAIQIRAALDRARILWTSDKLPAPRPCPISREDFHKLIKAATPTNNWRAWLLVGLNLCLHLGEVITLKWDSLDLGAGTHAQLREKTNIVRAAVLWPETIAALKALPKNKSPYVFPSRHGTKFNRNSRGNMFVQLRERAGVDAAVSFDGVRDGAFTAAINDPIVEERFARVLAGHRSAGLQDHYVLRNPKCTAEACAAVYRAYGPFT